MRFVAVCAAVLTACGGYREFTLPPQPGGPVSKIEWRADPNPVLEPGAAGDWDSVDVLNPSVIRYPGGYLNLYSGFDGRTWRTGTAESTDGLTWRKQGVAIEPDPADPDRYIAANGAAIPVHGDLFYLFQSGRGPRILGAARRGGTWRRNPKPQLETGPRGSWDERAVADPYLIEAGGRLYLYYLGMDRAGRQRLGVAVSDDALTWTKLRSNPILEIGDVGSLDENGLGEPAVWASNGFWWMLYTGRAANEERRLGLARSTDGVRWQKTPTVIAGDRSWNRRVLCDPTVIVENGGIRVWFGGGDIARPDENIHGRIGHGVLTIR